jgi:AcrR family transcriptional regulator
MPTQRRSQERYERILDACAHLLDEVGFSGLTTKEVARRAAVPIGTFYQFFADKDALVSALAMRNLEAYLARLTLHFEESPPATVAVMVDISVEEFVEMKRAVPGFGVVDFGAGGRADAGLAGEAHILDPDMDNNTAVAVRLRALNAVLFGPGESFDLAARVALECADAVLKLAFRVHPDGDPALIDECKRVLRCYLEDHIAAASAPES